MLTFRTIDHPEVGGRIPTTGEHAYTLDFPLEGGDTLHICCGEETLQRFSDLIGRLLIDNLAEDSDGTSLPSL